jgi:maleate cis-trans isomerase
VPWPVCSTGQILGWMKPADNLRSESDCYRVQSWLLGRAIRDIRTVVYTTQTTGVHRRADLFETGSLDHLSPVAAALADVNCSCVAWACTSGSFVGGVDWARAQVTALSRVTRCPVTSTSLAIVAALQHLECSHVHLLSPYPPDITTALEEFLAQVGIRVAVVRSLNAPTGRATFSLDLLEEARRFARALIGHPPHPILIPDNAANTLDLIEDLEATFQRPVITANQAVLWHALALMRRAAVATGAGELFRRSPDAANL